MAKPSRALVPAQARSTVVPTGVLDGIVFAEVRTTAVTFEPKFPEQGESRSLGVFGSRPEKWLDPAILPSLQEKYKVPVCSEEDPFVETEVWYVDWYEFCGFRFEEPVQKRILISTQLEDRRTFLIKRLLPEKCEFSGTVRPHYCVRIKDYQPV